MNVLTGEEFKILPFGVDSVLGEAMQPYRWSCDWRDTNTLDFLDLHFGIAGETLELNLLAFAVRWYGRRSVWEYWDTNTLEATTRSDTFPKKNVEAALRGHTDPILASLIATEIEAQHIALWNAATAIVEARAHARRANGVNEMAAWLSLHNGEFDLGRPQFRQQSIGEEKL